MFLLCFDDVKTFNNANKLFSEENFNYNLQKQIPKTTEQCLHLGQSNSYTITKNLNIILK